MSVVRSIAKEVDRLVLAVNGAASEAVGGVVAGGARDLGLSTPAFLKHFGEWLLSSGITEEVAVRRLPYAPDGVVVERLTEWRARGVVVERGGGRLVATAALAPLLVLLLDARADAAAGWWIGADSLGGVEAAVRTVVAGIGPGLEVAYDHAEVPLPGSRAQASHQLLTTLRYARAAAHVEAWTEAGLGRDDILALTALWSGAPVTRGTVDGLTELGFADDDGITQEGRQLRTHIEAETDRRNAPLFAEVDTDALLDGLRRLPSGP